MAKDQLTTIFIRSGTEYDSLVHTVASDLFKRKLVPFLGAGISNEWPSCLPLATGNQGLIKPLRDTFHTAIELSLNHFDADFLSIERAWAVVRAAPLERLLDSLFRTHGKLALEYLSVLNNDVWNWNHFAMAAFSNSGYLPWCITLNFDLLIERAIRDNGGCCQTVCPLTGDKFISGNGKPVTTIIKPHGSFAPKETSETPFDFLSATLSSTGARPAMPNEEAITSVFSQCPNLLVAGYRDDDWDIFPILLQVGKILHKVIWVEYISDEDLKKKLKPLPNLGHRNPLHDRVITWLQNQNIESVLLLGNVRYFFLDILNYMNLQLKDPKEGQLPGKPDATPFAVDLGNTNPASIRTYVSLAMLCGNCGSFCWSLMNWLSTHPILIRHPNLRWEVELLRSNAEHTLGQMGKSIRIMKKVLHLKRSFGDTITSTADDLVWLGYKYLCLTKRPILHRPTRILGIPYFLWKGLRLMNAGTHEGEMQKIKESPVKSKPGTMARYYRADLIHSWGNLFMLLGKKWLFFIALYLPLLSEVTRIFLNNQVLWKEVTISFGV
jgi:hypothetical protein